MIECSWKKHFGIDCLTCGFQRSFWLLTKGDLVESFVTFPAAIPFLLTILMTCIHLFFKLKNGAKYILILFSSTAAIMVINYIIKILNGDIFTK